MFGLILAALFMVVIGDSVPWYWHAIVYGCLITGPGIIALTAYKIANFKKRVHVLPYHHVCRSLPSSGIVEV